MQDMLKEAAIEQSTSLRVRSSPHRTPTANATNGQEMQRLLQLAYGDWKRSLHFEEQTAAQLSPPLLLSVPPAYTNAKRRILFCGQETYGWGFTSDLRTNFRDTKSITLTVTFGPCRIFLPIQTLWKRFAGDIASLTSRTPTR